VAGSRLPINPNKQFQNESTPIPFTVQIVKPAGAVPQTPFSSKPSGATLADKDAADPANQHAGRNP
jgi:hypothetical protein